MNTQMLGKKELLRFQEHPEQCPYCKSTRLEPGEIQEDHSQYFYCYNCRRDWTLFWYPGGIAVQGHKVMFTEVDNNATQDLYWFEVRRRDGREIYCPYCMDYYRSIYSFAANDELAVKDRNAGCWTCMEVWKYFPENQKDFDLPILFR